MTTGPGTSRPQGEGAPYPHESGTPPEMPGREPSRRYGTRMLIGIATALVVALLVGALVVFLATRTAGEVGAPTVAITPTPTGRPRRAADGSGRRRSPGGPRPPCRRATGRIAGSALR